MPKIVDHDGRRRAIADAMWTVLERDGIEGVSVRGVSAQAGISKATLAHYFGGQYDLLLFAMAESIEVVTKSLRDQRLENADLAKFTAAVCQVVPTTAARRRQSEIWLALVARAQSDPALRTDLAEVNRSVAAGLRELLGLMRNQRLIAKRRDLDIETMRLHALVDGLTLHTLTDSKATSPAKIRRLVGDHLAELAR